MTYVHQPYPSWRYHPFQPPVLIQNPDEEARLTPPEDGWTDSITEAQQMKAELEAEPQPRKKGR